MSIRNNKFIPINKQTILHETEPVHIRFDKK
jgi:hypothetical protein